MLVTDLSYEIGSTHTENRQMNLFPWGELEIYIHAEIMDGQYSGKEVEISDLSISSLDKEIDSFLLYPNHKQPSFEGIS